MITPAHKNVVEKYLSDLEGSVAHVRAHPELATQGRAAAYGMLARLPERGTLDELILQHLDGTYRS
jgi:hypothetical protein